MDKTSFLLMSSNLIQFDDKEASDTYSCPIYLTWLRSEFDRFVRRPWKQNFVMFKHSSKLLNICITEPILLTFQKVLLLPVEILP